MLKSLKPLKSLLVTLFKVVGTETIVIFKLNGNKITCYTPAIFELKDCIDPVTKVAAQTMVGNIFF